jgi:hypothetical protein
VLTKNGVVDTEYIKHKLLKDNKKMIRSKKKANFSYMCRRAEVLCKNPHRSA